MTYFGEFRHRAKRLIETIARSILNAPTYLLFVQLGTGFKGFSFITFFSSSYFSF